MLFRDPLENKSKVSQKPYCNDFCQVVILKDLVDGELEKDFIKASNASVWGCFFIKQRCFQASCTKMYYKQGCLQKDLSDRCLHTELSPFLVVLFSALS